jgi:XTP/dITP diphosphohydrolase
MPTRIVLASTNQGKVREFARLFADPRILLLGMTEVVPPDFEVEETGATFEENAWLKALALCQLTGLPALSDDSGLEVDALGGRPGVYSARYAGPGCTDEDNNTLLLRELLGVETEQRTARFVCCLAFATPTAQGPTRQASARAKVDGRILTAPRGSQGFGYDPLFEPCAYVGQTTAELRSEEKDRISHRGQAARQIFAAMVHWLDTQAPS